MTGTHRSSTANGQPDLPRTVVGVFLRHVLEGEPELIKKWAAKLNGGQLGWNYDEAGVVQAAAELAVKQLWGNRYDVRDITEVVTFMRAAREEAGKTPPGQLEMEAVIRAALGEPDIDTSGIGPAVIFEIQVAVTGYVTLKLAFTESTIAQLIIDAENLSFERGWNPPLLG